MPEKGINILCIDGGGGGGVRGLSSLFLLREILGRIGELEGTYDVLKPSDHFDVIAGTGSGAVSACMLGRLCMQINQAIQAYVKLFSAVYPDKDSFAMSSTSSKNGTKLRTALKALVRSASKNEDERMIVEHTETQPCKTMVFAMSKRNLNANIPVLFRSYQSHENAAPDCTIWEALYASMAHPDLFKSIDIGDGALQESFVGGELGCSNPLVHVLAEVRRLYPDQHVSCVLSIGAGHTRTISLSHFGLSRRLLMAEDTRTMMDMVADSERVAEEIEARFQDTTGVYYRFNVDQGMQNVDPSDWEKKDQVAAHTRAYIGGVEPKRGLDQAARAVKERKPTIPARYLDGRVQASPTKKVAQLRHCPPPSSAFTGREDQIQQVAACITDSANERRVCVIYGLGGAGKTQLALKTIAQHRRSWIHVIYIDASSRETLESVLQEVAKAKTIGDTSEDTLRWLESCQEPWLLIYDGADQPSLDIHNYFPGGSCGSILITTRLTSMRMHAIGPSSECHISHMSHEDARILLFKLGRVESHLLDERDARAANELLEDFGHFVLAIVHAGAYIGYSRRSISEFRELFLARRRSMLEQYSSLKVKIDSYQWSVFTTWNLCYELLDSDGDSRPLLWLIAHMHPSHITENIFKTAAIQLQKYKSLLPQTEKEKNARDYVQKYLSRFLDNDGIWDTTLFANAISDLASYSLVEFDQINSSYSIHVLVQEWARTVIPQTKDLALECTTTLLAYAVDMEDTIPARRARIDLGLHVMKVLSEQEDSVGVNHSLLFATVCRETWSRDREAKLLLKATKVLEIELGPKHETTLFAMCSLASSYYDQGELDKAEELQAQVLHAHRTSLGEDHVYTLQSMNNLSMTYWKKGQRDKAQELQVEILDKQRRILGEEHQHTLLGMNNLASMYLDQGRWDEAERLLVNAVDALGRLLGEEDLTTLECMSNLGSIYRRQGKLDKAREVQMKTVSSFERTLGKEHPLTLASMQNLAITFENQGDLDKAKSLLEIVVEMRTRLFGDQAPSTVEARKCLANVESQLLTVKKVLHYLAVLSRCI